VCAQRRTQPDGRRSPRSPLSGTHRRPFGGKRVQGAGVVVTMGCGDACPIIPGKEYVDWNLPDPVGMCLEEVRELRAVIDQKIAALPG
jgi:arsenate reductase (thioredoxin)